MVWYNGDSKSVKAGCGHGVLLEAKEQQLPLFCPQCWKNEDNKVAPRICMTCGLMVRPTNGRCRFCGEKL